MSASVRAAVGQSGLEPDAIRGIGFDRETLISAGVQDADAFAAVSSGDNSNIIAARVARETFGVQRVVRDLNKLYRDTPDAARVVSRAEGTLKPGDIACTVGAWHGAVTAGLHKVGGGSGELACSADMLLETLIAG